MSIPWQDAIEGCFDEVAVRFEWDAAEGSDDNPSSNDGGNEVENSSSHVESSVHPATVKVSDSESECASFSICCDAPEIMRAAKCDVEVRVSVALDGINFVPAAASIKYTFK